jgi:glycosyltransferase involved in cell wall biosynthesis
MPTSGQSPPLTVHFDHQVFSFQRYGGISRYFVEIARRMSRTGGVGCQMSVRYSDNEYLRSWGQIRVQPSLSVPGLGSRGKFLATYLANGIRSRRALGRGDFDVFHPTFYDDYFLRRLGNRPFVVTVHDMIPERLPELFPRKTLYQRKVTGRWVDNKARLVRSAARVIAITEHTKADLVSIYGLSPDQIDVIWQAGSISCAAPSKSGSSAPARYLLFVGARGGYKNFVPCVEALCPALRADRRLSLRCVGGGPLSALEQDAIANLGIGPQVVQLDVDDAALAVLYAGAEALVFPSLYEGFGIPIVEAMTCGCPCIVSDSRCFREVAADAVEYFDPHDRESMAAAVDRVLRDRDRRVDLIGRGHDRSRMFSWDRTADQTLAVYRTCTQ